MDVLWLVKTSIYSKSFPFWCISICVAISILSSYYNNIYLFDINIMPSMKKFIVFRTALLAATVLEFSIISMNSIQIFATVERSALESIDLHLGECIKQLQANYTKNALSHCEISEQELDVLLENITASK
jgi:hypothetical protein